MASVSLARAQTFCCRHMPAHKSLDMLDHEVKVGMIWRPKVESRVMGLRAGHALSSPGGMDRIRASMGVCPQFDILWSELTGREHLRLYGHVKVIGVLSHSETSQDSSPVSDHCQNLQ